MAPGKRGAARAAAGKDRPNPTRRQEELAFLELSRTASLRRVIGIAARFHEEAKAAGDPAELEARFEEHCRAAIVQMCFRSGVECAILELDAKGTFTTRFFTALREKMALPEMRLLKNAATGAFLEPEKCDGMAPYCVWWNTQNNGVIGVLGADDVSASNDATLYMRDVGPHPAWFPTVPAPDVYKKSKAGGLSKSVLVAPLIVTVSGTDEIIYSGVITLTHPEANAFKMQDCAWIDACSAVISVLYSLRELNARAFRASSGAAPESVPSPPSSAPAKANGSAERGLVLLHLSDVHFGKKPPDTKMHRFRPEDGMLYTTKSLADHIAEECGKERELGTLIVAISGDIAYQAARGEYEAATKFVERLRTDLGLVRGHLIVVPGNHDVSWALSTAEPSYRFDEYLNFVFGVYGEDIKEFYPFLNWDGRTTSTRPSPADIFSFHKLDAAKVVLLGFNSCVLEDEKLHFGAIGRRQLEHAEAKLKGVDPSWLRVAVMHHHVLPLENRLLQNATGVELDASLVRDYALVERSFHEMGIDLVLHGHKHEPGIRTSNLIHVPRPGRSKSMIVCGAGSAGVVEDELPHGRGNHFGIYRLPPGARKPGHPFLEVEWKELPYTDVDTRWKEVGRWKIEG